MTRKIGIDAGGTLTKVAYWDEQGELQLLSFPSSDFGEVENWINSIHTLVSICLTGGRAEQLRKYLHAQQDIPYIVEFDATMAGVMYQLKLENISCSKAIVANIGTGTSIHLMCGEEHSRLGGTGIGGGTLIGLSQAISPLTSYEQIIEQSKTGNRSVIDILVSDIYARNELPINGSLTASNFGGVAWKSHENIRSADYLSGIQGIIGEVVASLAIQAGDAYDVKQLIFIGSTLENNDLLKEIIEKYTVLKNKKPIFLEKHGYSGAIGALLESI